MMLDYHSLTTHVLSGMRLNERDELEATSRRFAMLFDLQGLDVVRIVEGQE